MTATKPTPTRHDAAETSHCLLDTLQAARFLGVSKRTLQELTSDRKIAAIRFGRNVRFDPADLARFIEAHRVLPVGWKSGGAK